MAWFDGGTYIWRETKCFVSVMWRPLKIHRSFLLDHKHSFPDQSPSLELNSLVHPNVQVGESTPLRSLRCILCSSLRPLASCPSLPTHLLHPLKPYSQN